MANDKGQTRAVLEALSDGPKSSIQLVRMTGLTKAQVGDVLRALRGRTIKSHPVRYELIPTNCAFTDGKNSCEIRAG